LTPTPSTWIALALLTLAFASALHAAGLPAGFLLGALIAAVVLAARGRVVRIPRTAFLVAQSVLGCLIANAFSGATLVALEDHGLVLGGATLVPIAAAACSGWLLSRYRILPTTTGVWGAFPGAASAMVLMSEAFGADIRLVAFMQYTRVLCVVLVASVVAYVVTGGTAAPVETSWFPPLDAAALGATLALVAVGTIGGRLVRFPATALLSTVFVGAFVHLAFGATFALPPWLLVLAYTVLGWAIGMRFDAPVLRHARKSLVPILASIAALIACSGLLALVLSRTMHIDLLTAYLATSPGGVDSIAIIAASTHVDAALVMAVQVLRFVLLTAIGPLLAKLVARMLPPEIRGEALPSA
jgi:membrane AbrB-like protein